MSSLARWARLAGRFVVLEVQLYGALGRWIARRPDVPAGAEAWGYSRLVTPVLWLWIFGSACEVPLAHVLVPWHGVRVALLVLGVWGLVWMIGLLASLKVYPHLVTDDGLVLRNGKFARFDVPWSQIASVRIDDHDVDGMVLSWRPRETGEGTELQMPASGRVNVAVRLSRPLVAMTSRGPVSASILSVWADEPRAMVASASGRIAAARRPRAGRDVGGAA